MPLRKVFFSIAAMLVIGLAASNAKADVVGFCTDVPGQSGLGACSKTVRITQNSPMVGGFTVTIILTNNSPAPNGGFITADAFNLTAGTQIRAGSFTSTDPDFGLTTGVISANPFPDRNALISTGGQFEGGGNPNVGIGVGQTATFTFIIESLNGNTELSIFSSEAIRFRGFNDGNSDKALVTTNPVPEPATMLLLGSGLAGIAGAVRRRRRSEK